MENSGILACTLILVISFGFLGVGTFLEFRKMNQNRYTGNERITNATVFSAFLDKFFS